MCTGIRFNDNKGNFYFGRNLDWTTDYGEKVIITPRGFKYNSALLGEMEPKAGAIIGMAIIEEEKPLYFDCVNESGLAIAGLNFPGYAEFAKKPAAPTPNELLNSTEINEKINVAAYEFPLYVALNFSTVDEAAEALKNVVIVDKPINEKFPTSPLHYFIADKSRSIVVEYTKNGMEIYDNDTDILTNQPGFTWHRENLRNYMNIFPNFPRSATWGLQKTTGTRPNAELLPFGTGALMQGLPGGYSPADRFIRAAYFNTHYPVQTSETENVSRLFKTLSAVSMIEGAGLASDGKFEITIYTSCYSSAEKTYYYNTYHDMALKKVAFADFPLDNGTLITAS